MSKKNEFSLLVNEKMINDKLEVIDAVLAVCDDLGLGYDEVNGLLTDDLKERIAVESGIKRVLTLEDVI